MKTQKKFLLLACGMIASSMFFFSRSNAQATPKLTDPEVASVAVTANQIDVDYAKLAEKKAKTPSVVEFAKTMDRDHNAVIQKAVALATKLHVTPKDNAITQSLLKGEKSTLKTLKSKSGKAFEKAYIDNEVTYHKFAINAVKTILIPNSHNAELKALLESALPLFQSHLEHAEMVQKNYK